MTDQTLTDQTLTLTPTEMDLVLRLLDEHMSSPVAEMTPTLAQEFGVARGIFQRVFDLKVLTLHEPEGDAQRHTAKGPATTALRKLHDILWPPENPDEPWDADTLERVADVLDAAKHGRDAFRPATVTLTQDIARKAGTCPCLQGIQPPPMRIRKLTEKDVSIRVVREFEADFSPDWETDEGGPDTALIAKVLKAAKSNVWAWCSVTVTAEWMGWKGRAHLGGCSYKDEADFSGPDGYLPQMVEEAIDDLNKALESAAALLDTLSPPLPEAP